MAKGLPRLLKGLLGLLGEALEASISLRTRRCNRRHEGGHQSHLVRVGDGRLLRRRVPYHHLGGSQFLLHRNLDEVLVQSPHAVFAKQLLEVVQRVVVRAPVGLGQPAQVPSRRVVPNQILRLSQWHVPRRLQHQRPHQRAKVRWSARAALQLLGSNFFHQCQQLVPIDFVCQHHQTVVRLDDYRRAR